MKSAAAKIFFPRREVHFTATSCTTIFGIAKIPKAWCFFGAAKQLLSTWRIRRADQRKEGLVPLLRRWWAWLCQQQFNWKLTKTWKFRSFLYSDDSRRWRTSASLSWLRSWLTKSFPQFRSCCCSSSLYNGRYTKEPKFSRVVLSATMMKTKPWAF